MLTTFSYLSRILSASFCLETSASSMCFIADIYFEKDDPRFASVGLLSTDIRLDKKPGDCRAMVIAVLAPLVKVT